MLAAPIPLDEDERLTALRSFDLLDSEPEAAFDDLTELASGIAGVPIALVSLVDEDRQWFKSRQGLGASETSRDVSFCGHAIHLDRALVVEDSHQDPRFRDNPLVTGAPSVRFYAGVPLRPDGGDGSALGTLCVIGHEPRRLELEQVRALELLGKQVARLMVLRRTSSQLAQATRRSLALEGIVQTYTPRTVWTRLNELVRGAHDRNAGERVTRAFLFTDICGYTELSRTLSPEELGWRLSHTIGAITDVILDHGGDVEKFIGDCVFAHFEDAGAALDAVLGVQDVVDRLAATDRERGRTPLQVRTGAHWGAALRTHVGSARRRDNTLIGDAVNLAARLQQAAKPGEVLVSSDLLQEAGGGPAAVEVRRLRLKGIDRPVSAHVLRSEAPPAPALVPLPLGPSGRSRPR